MPDAAGGTVVMVPGDDQHRAGQSPEGLADGADVAAARGW